MESPLKLSLLTIIIALAMLLATAFPVHAAPFNGTDNYQKTWSYAYTGGAQTFTAPVAGYYSVQLWGARGGDTNLAGAKGGYSYGVTHLAKGATFNIFVGGNGGNGTGDNGGTTGIMRAGGAGGYNGGGSGQRSQSGYMSGSGGGGATDIRFNSDAVDTYTTTNRALVAGGGGGNTSNHFESYSTRSYGGGLAGGYGSRRSACDTWVNNWATVAPGTQTSGYGLGNGQPLGSGNAKGPTVASCGAEGNGGGGGGYYGGRAYNSPAAEVASDASGGGGSSYISATTFAPLTINGIAMTSGTIAGNATMPTFISGTPTTGSATPGAVVALLSAENIATPNYNGTSEAKTAASDKIKVNYNPVEEKDQSSTVSPDEAQLNNQAMTSGKYEIYYSKDAGCLAGNNPPLAPANCWQSVVGGNASPNNLRVLYGLDPDTEYYIRVRFSSSYELYPFEYWYPLLRARTLPLNPDGSAQIVPGEECDC